MAGTDTGTGHDWERRATGAASIGTGRQRGRECVGVQTTWMSSRFLVRTLVMPTFQNIAVIVSYRCYRDLSSHDKHPEPWQKAYQNDDNKVFSFKLFVIYLKFVDKFMSSSI